MLMAKETSANSTEILPVAIRLRGIKLITLAAGLYLALRLIGIHKLVQNDAEGIGALVQIIGTLYSVVYAFAIYVIWDNLPRWKMPSRKKQAHCRISSSSARH